MILERLIDMSRRRVYQAHHANVFLPLKKTRALRYNIAAAYVFFLDLRTYKRVENRRRVVERRDDGSRSDLEIDSTLWRDVHDGSLKKNAYPK